MGQITSLFVNKVINEIDGTFDKIALLQLSGIDPDPLMNPSQMVTADDYYSFFERAAAVDSNPTTLPLRVGAAMSCDDYGAFGLAWKSATDLRGSYGRAERFARILTSVSTYTVEWVEAGALMHLNRTGTRSLGLRFSNEATIASIASISRQVATKKFVPLAVFFKHRAPKVIAAHEEYFGCPVHFESDKDALLVSNETMRIPNKLGDNSISSFFDSHLIAELSKLTDEDLLDRKVRIHITQALSDGVPAISDVAKHLGMSGRTLQRRLSELGYTYQALVDDSRRQLADHLLRESNYSLAEVTFMTGFSEQSAFTRAFKRWKGQTPRSFRLL
ncbi:AraC family transcriptional regulator [uncultured Desulfuromusa sp.]|uniref:AraC family transcriptional regulator n=1 Tax=uncultured Desulfuromusa sp. TaxID=219183 RepID=UPI0037487DE0